MLQLTAALHFQEGESEFPEGVPYFLRIFCAGIHNSILLGDGDTRFPVTPVADIQRSRNMLSEQF